MDHRDDHSADVATLFSECSEHYYAGRTTEGVHLAALGVRVARKQGDIVWLRRLLTAQGILEADLHNLPQAFEAFADALELCGEIDDPESTHSVWNNISCALLYAELPDLAISAARIADEHASAIADPNTRSLRRAIALSNESCGSLLARRYGAGLRAAVLAHEQFEARYPHRLAESGGELGNLLILMTHRIRLLLRANFLDEAQLWAAKTEALSKASQGSRRIAYVVEMTSALCDAYLGRFDRGVARLQEIAATTASVTPVLVADALRDLCEAHSVGNRPDLASKYMCDLAKHMRQVRAESALFHHERHVRWVAAISPPSGRKRAGQDAIGALRSSTGRVVDQGAVLRDLCAAAELYDDASGMHPHRVGELAHALATKIGAHRSLLERIANAARLHDIGKIGIPPSILGKPSSLDRAETEIMRTHTTAGAELLASADIEDWETSVAVARHHHEWWSGAGYPDGLAHEAIPLAARITAIAESFDAMTHDRPYRPKLSTDRALSIIAERAGRQFDPRLASVFPTVIREIESEHGDDLDSFLQRSAHASPFLRAQRRLAAQMSMCQRQGVFMS